MIDQFRTVSGWKRGNREKKSRFIATVRLVESEEEALSCLEALRKKYWDARHNCFVYIIGENQETVRAAATTGSLPARQGGRCSMWYREQASAMCLLW